jgi:hypothetical protein
MFLSFNASQCGHQSRPCKRRQYLSNSTPRPRQHIHRRRSKYGSSNRSGQVGKGPCPSAVHDVFDKFSSYVTGNIIHAQEPTDAKCSVMSKYLAFPYRSTDQEIVHSSAYNGTKIGWCTILMEIGQLISATICGNTKFSILSRWTPLAKDGSITRWCCHWGEFAPLGHMDSYWPKLSTFWREITAVGIRHADFAGKWRTIGRYSSLTN